MTSDRTHQRMEEKDARIAELEAELAALRGRTEALLEAGRLACSALDLHPDHADTCQHSLNAEYECNCWRAVVYEASVDLTDAALAASPAEDTTPAALPVFSERQARSIRLDPPSREFRVPDGVTPPAAPHAEDGGE